MKKLLVLFVTFLFIFPTWVSAACSGAACSDVYIDMLYLNASGYHLVQTSGDEGQLTNCTPISGVYLKLPDTTNKKDILAMLLTAQTTDKKVQLRMSDNGNGADCEITYATLQRQ